MDGLDDRRVTPGLRTLPVDRAGAPGHDEVIVEEPLELRIEGIAAAVTMRTPGADLDLAAGFLLTEGVVDGWDDVRALAQVSANVVDVRLREGVPAARARSADRALYATSSCGICGIASLDRMPRPRKVGSAWVPEAQVLATVLALLPTQMPWFAATGGCHGAALFDRAGTVVSAREDVGRHNAVDKVLGSVLRADGEFDGLALIVSSRAGFEIVQKAAAAGVGALVCLGAATSLAADAAAYAGLPLFGWAARGLLRYGGPPS